MAASRAAAAGASETWEQYEARLIEFLRSRGAGGHPMAQLGSDCAYAPARGEKGFFSKLARSKPHIFEFADPDCEHGPRLLRLTAALREPPAPRVAAAPAAAPPVASWLSSEEEEYAARLVAFLRDSGAPHDIYALSKACQMPSHLLFEHSSQGKGFFRRFLAARPQLFKLDGPNVRLARSQLPDKQAAASKAPVSGAAASSSESAYEARLVAYLRQTPGGELGLANIADRCPWDGALPSLRSGHGKGSGVYSAFVRARPHMFELVPREHGQHVVRLVPRVRGQQQEPVPPPPQQASSPPRVLWQAQERPEPPAEPLPAAQPPPQTGPETPGAETAAEYEARLVAFIRGKRPQTALVSRIGLECPWEAARGVPGAYTQFIRARPHLFQLVRREKGGHDVRLVHQQPLPPPRAAASPQAAPPPQQPQPQPRAVPPYTPPAEPAYAPRPLLPPPPPSLLPPAPLASVAAPPPPPAMTMAPTEAVVPPLLQSLQVPLPVPLPLPLLMPQWGPPPPPPLPTSLPPSPAGADDSAAAAPAAPPRVSLSGPAELRSSAGGAAATIELTLVNGGAATVVVCSAAIRAPRPDLRLLPATPLPRVLVPEGKLVLALQHSGEAPCVATVVVDVVVESTNDKWYLPNAPQPQTAVATAAVALRCA